MGIYFILKFTIPSHLRCKMLNGGADILTVQELLAHASPEMTLRYAKLLDNTKRKAFESVMKQGVLVST